MKNQLLITLLALALDASAQSGCPLSSTQGQEIRDRGTLLAEYDQIAWHGTDAVMALKPPEASISEYIARKTDVGWVMFFGRMSEDSKTYILVYEVRQNSSGKYEATKLKKERPDTAFFLYARQALATAREEFNKREHPNRPYNFSIIPASDARWFVYAVPAQTDNDVYPLGGDYRFLVSNDGRKVVETRQLHKTILDLKRVPEGTTEAAGYHTHVLSSIPEDTDVFHVLARSPKIPEYIATKDWVFVVSPDKPIACIPMKAFEKAAK
jgi:hypothetical protein